MIRCYRLLQVWWSSVSRALVGQGKHFKVYSGFYRQPIKMFWCFGVLSSWKRLNFILCHRRSDFWLFLACFFSPRSYFCLPGCFSCVSVLPGVNLSVIGWSLCCVSGVNGQTCSLFLSDPSMTGPRDLVSTDCSTVQKRAQWWELVRTGGRKSLGPSLEWGAAIFNFRNVCFVALVKRGF